MASGGDERQDERDTRELAMLRATGRDNYRSAASRERKPMQRPERKPRRD